MLSDEPVFISHFENERCKVFPVFTGCLAFKELDVFVMLRIPASKLPVDYGLYHPVPHNDVAGREVSMGEADTVIRSHPRTKAIADGIGT